MIRVGIIGCGKIAQVRHIPEYQANPETEIAGYFDLNLDRAKELAEGFGGRAYETIEEMLSDESKLKEQGRQSQQLIHDVFSWERTSEKYIRLFSKIVRESRELKEHAVQ